MKNITICETEKLRDYFTQLIEVQIHRFGPGRIILHFSKDKEMMEIEVQRVAWRKKKKITP